MKVGIEVKNRREAESVRRAMARPDVRAFVLVIGELEALPTERAKERVMNFVTDYFDENSR